MDIKLRARLSAYSKVSSISNNEDCEHIIITDKDIDNLFENMDEPQSVKKNEIDSLFATQDEPESVTKNEIDSLFEEVVEPEAVSKDEIDDLFVQNEETITSVSYKEIDSLFG